MVSTSALLRAVVCVVPFVPGDLHRLLSFLNWQPTVQALVLPKARSLQPRPNQLDIPLRISPLGASVTWGTGSTDGNGHRGPLCASLVGAGYTVNMVGFTLNGAMKDNENDGYPGLVVHEIHGKSDRVSWELKPNLFLINAGLKAVYADMSAITVGDLVDGTHPNDGGYKKMADGWFRAIQEASNRGWIS
ncbi:hypothetical protein DL763_004218 [Monosporascus cannonballus]|nr:hypothetical protein DL763_004218 [Monosporascus cannonballus]